MICETSSGNMAWRLKQGWLCLLQNGNQLFSTIGNVSNVTRVKTTVKQDVKCEHRNRKHIECQPARMKKDERIVEDL